MRCSSGGGNSITLARHDLPLISVEQICVDNNGNILVSSGALCVYKFSVRSLSWEAFSCPFTLPESSAVRLVGCSVSNSSDIYATFAWLLNDNRLVICNIGYKFLDKVSLASPPNLAERFIVDFESHCMAEIMTRFRVPEPMADARSVPVVLPVHFADSFAGSLMFSPALIINNPSGP